MNIMWLPQAFLQPRLPKRAKTQALLSLRNSLCSSNIQGNSDWKGQKSALPTYIPIRSMANDYFMMLGEFWKYGDGDKLLYAPVHSVRYFCFCPTNTPNPRSLSKADTMTEFVEKKLVTYLKNYQAIMNIEILAPYCTTVKQQKLLEKLRKKLSLKVVKTYKLLLNSWSVCL